MSAPEVRRVGARVEELVVSLFGFVESEGEEFDARLRDGRPVEVKAARRRLASGRSGRFAIGRRQHERLREHDGVYVFAVYREVEDDVGLEHVVRASAEFVERSPQAWVDARGGRCSHSYQMQIPASQVVARVGGSG